MKEKILAMEAGRELDALVAEKVLGYLPQYTKPSEHPYPLVKRFSTDIHAAWEIRDRMFEQPVPIRNKFIEDTNYDIFHINPMMICKAALLAVMGE